ncbi:glycosyltransferase [Nocardia crassostreae]|uniref:glycosyltransferase n=1 Tax=Nocardia crassostreae TaxID=53428 RepID=UPI000A048B7B|nr:glycosyltransferase [Nocardia crassostreae]
MIGSRTGEYAVRAGTAIAALGAGLALINRITLRQLRTDTHTVIEPVTVCVPARNEADRLPDLIADLRAQQAVPRLRVLILDDASTDDTYRSALDAVGEDPRFTVVRNEIEPPDGWTGKNAACARLAELAGIDAPAMPGGATRHPSADGAGTWPGDAATTLRRIGAEQALAQTVSDEPGALVFLDADVRLRSTAIAAAVGELRRTGAALVCPWPVQRAESVAEALVQPLLCWSWAASLPVIAANRSLRPSTAVACGQFLVFDATAYRATGGHTAVADQVTEDLAIARQLRRAGRRTALVAGGRLAHTRMYRSSTEVDEGYSRWLWSAYGGRAGSTAVGAGAALAFWLPPLAAIFGRGRLRRIGILGYTAAVTGRLLARSTESGGRPSLADLTATLAHPISIAAYLRLSARSHRAHDRGTLVWKGRALSSRESS